MEQMRFDLGFCKNSKIKVILHVYYILDIIFQNESLRFCYSY